MTGASGRRRPDLPADVTSLVGRRQEIAAVKRLLSSSRLVTLTGLGGVGKTRLAIASAREVRRSFPDGVRLIELDGVTEPGLLELTVLQALDVDKPDDDLGGLIGYLKDRHLLLLLDNCEHLVEEVAALATNILRDCPEITIIATSRERLSIDGEAVMAVPPLAVPPGDPSATEERADALELFAQRAAAVAPEFTISEENAPAVAELCRQLDGLPLAIELAAVSMRAISLDGLLARHEQHYDFLSRGNRTAAPRHQTLRAAVDWSFDLCTTSEQRLWMSLSVFVGTFDLQLAEQVCKDEDLSANEVATAYAGLVDKSILSRDDGPGPLRHRLLETIRTYGRERLRESGHEERLRKRHRDTFLALAERAESEWFSPRQGIWSARLRTEHTNLRTALDFCSSRPSEVAAGLHMAVGLSSYWMACGQQREGRLWLERLLRADTSPSSLRAHALCVNAHLAALSGDGRAALRLLAHCAKCDSKDPVVVAYATYVAGLARLGADPRRAVICMEDAVRLERANNDASYRLPLAQLTLGLALCISGEVDRAIDVLREVQTMCEDHGDRWVLAWSLMLTGVAEWLRGEPTQATVMLRKSLLLKRELGDMLGVALAMEFLGWCAEATGDAESAARLFGSSRTLFEPLGSYLVSIRLFLEWHERCARRVREDLGDGAYQRMEGRGRQLPLDDAVSYAMGLDPAARVTSVAHSGPVLTKRESQVATLVAEGLSNREIASRLVIAPRTADSHVEHILTKLGFSSRTQVAAWVVGGQVG